MGLSQSNYGEMAPDEPTADAGSEQSGMPSQQAGAMDEPSRALVALGEELKARTGTVLSETVARHERPQ